MAPITRVVALLCILSAVQQIIAGGYGKRNRHLKQPIVESRRYYNHKPVPIMRPDTLPVEFNWANKTGINFLTPNWNQHIPTYCGSCFLHATLTTIADRLKVLKVGSSPDVMLGRQTFLNCAPSLGYSKGCDGGDVIDVLEYMSKVGIPDEGCMPYRAKDHRVQGLEKGQQCAPIDSCMNCMPDKHDEMKSDCWPVKTPTIYKLSSYGNVGETKPSPNNVAAMMSEIYQRGPIVCSISCPQEFTFAYNGGIFFDKTNDTDVDHDVEVVGWGEESGVKFWRVRNSWGQYWGELGFFRIPRGVNAQQLEAGDCWYAEPTWEVEKSVVDGTSIGSMWGIHGKKPAPAQVLQDAALGKAKVEVA